MTDTKHEIWLTTDDNPWNPFTHPDEWNTWDRDYLGYGTMQYWARIARINDDAMSESEIEAEWERAAREIVTYDFMNIYRIVTPTDY